MKKVWGLILEKLQQNFPDDYILWFSQLEFENIDNHHNMVLSVASKTIQKNISDRFTKTIEEISGSLLGFEPKLKVIVKIPPDENLFQDTPEFKKMKVEKPTLLKKDASLYTKMLNPKFTFERFVPGSNSDLAYKAAQFIAQTENGIYERFNPFFIYGGVGLGKTHILQGMGNYAQDHYPNLQIIYVTAEKYMNDYIEASITKQFKKFRDFYRNADILLVDDIQFLENREKLQDEVFNNFNYLHQLNKQIVFTCDKHPKDLKNVQERLISRFSWGLSVDIKPPDFETRKNILIKKMQESGIQDKIEEDILVFLAENITQNIRDIESAIIKITSIILLTESKITLSLIKEELKDLLTKSKVESLGITTYIIQDVVSLYYSTDSNKIHISDLKSKSRTNNIAFARHMAIFITKSILPYSLSKIGEEFGNRDHSTILASIKKIDKEIQMTSSIRHDYEELLKLLTKY